ncbi:hypothetical protein CsSME_00002538 [Camellia sinensis var. sinensis]
MMLDIDYHGNTVLHIAASQHYQGLAVFGPAKSMTWEVFWFKRVRDDCHPSFLYHRNYDGKTAQEVFEKNHIEMRKEAEKAAKDMNSGLMLVSTIIGSVNYAALFTPPGGLDQISGLPIFTNRTATERSDLQLFSYYIGGSLVAALLALGTQLSIQLSRFGNNEFLISLPFKYLLASTALFYATSFSVTACYQTYILETVFEKSFYWAMSISFILMILVYIDTLYPTFSYMYEMSFAACNLLQTIPSLPKVTLPPLPTMPTIPTLPMPTLPQLPTTQIPSTLHNPTLATMPTVPQLTLPSLPATSLPTFLTTIPSIPTIPTTMPTISFCSPPPSN